jgi:hypothetical protein
VIKKQELVSKIIVISVLFSVFVNFGLNTQFYPKLLNYQAGNSMVKVIKNHNNDQNNIYMTEGSQSWTLNFYTARETPEVAVSDINNIKGKWLFVYDKDMDKLKSQNITWSKSYEVDHFKVTRLSLSFLNPKTRNSILGKAYLLQID